VLDNASTDGSVEAIERQFTAVQIIPLTENKGYAGNNNVGIEAALAQGADWVFVLNEDTILHPDCVCQMVSVAQSDPHIGIIGPMVYHHSEPRTIQTAGGHMNKFWEAQHIAENEPDQGQFYNVHDVNWISGCAIMVKRQLIEQVGVLDERFFYYWEETEWCMRAQKAGWRIVHVPQARLWHKGVQRDYQPSPNVTYSATRNRLLALQKHRAGALVWVYTLGQMARTLLSWTVKPKWRDKRPHRAAMWQGICDFLAARWGMRQT
jgi:GT2 family glycosyltransferase